ncbi:hypothetical protein [Bradyrhizobium sp. S3.9.1]|uniref:hypothetical protein n=1 Tax=Bradyrhizobium sp. S3.9.1 TaxID=3156431 RepID=UPI0033992C15
MSSRNWLFKPAEIRRAIKSIQSAGLEVSQVEVGRHGQIVINVVRQPAPTVQQVVADVDANP